MKAITLTVLLSTLSLNSFSQIKREVFFNEKLNRDVVTRYSENALIFDLSLLSEEKIYVNVKSDSLNNGFINLYIYVYFPKNINPKGSDIVLGYTDGTTEVFKQSRFDNNDNYTEYSAIQTINNIASKKVNYITFRGIKKFNVSEKTYFVDFIKNL